MTRRLGVLLAIALLATGAAATTAGALAYPAPAYAQTAPTAPAATAPAPQPSSQQGSSLTTWTLSALGTALGWVLAEIASFFAWLLGVAALSLDVAIYYTVVHMGDFVTNVTNIGVAWRVLRDLGNIALIFGFLISGIAVIIDVPFYGFGSKMLPKLLIAAVLLNFSLLVSEVVIDAGNLFATEIYTQINGGSLPGTAQFGGNSPVVNEGISNRIMSVLGLQSIYQTDNSNASTLASAPLSNAPLVAFMSILLFLVAAFVFFSLTFMIVARFVALIFIMIAAPLGFAGLAIPGLNKIAGKWWSMLVDQTIMAPVLILLLYVALAVITDAKFLTSLGLTGSNASNTAQQGWLCSFGTNTATTANGAALCSGAGSGLQYFASTMLVFILAMGLLLAVVIVAKQMSAFGASFATKWGGRLSLMSVAAATPGFIGRNTIGLGSVAGGRAWRSSRLARIPVLGRAGAAMFDKGAKASFDWRPTDGKAKVGGVELNVGRRQKGGAAAEEKAALKAREDHAKGLQQTKAEKEEQNKWEDRKKVENESHAVSRAETEVHHRVERQPIERQIQEQRARVGELRAIATRTRAEADTRALADAELTLSNMSRERDDLLARQQEFYARLEGLHKEAVANIDKNIEDIKARPREEYAERISKAPQDWPVPGGWPFSRYVNTKAADNIKKEARKKKSERDLETLERILERGEGGGGEGGGAAAGGEGGGGGGEAH